MRFSEQPQPNVPTGPEVNRPEVLQSPEQLTFDSIDFETIKNIFQEIASRAGIQEKVNFVDKQNIVLSSRRFVVFSSSHYHPLTGAIKVGKKHQKDAATMLSVICHEEAHAVSAQHPSCYESGEVDNPKEVQVGFHTVFVENGKGKDSHYRWFNEGFTDEIASIVFSEYLQRKPLVDIKKEERVTSQEFFSNYSLARLFVHTFIEKLSVECGVPYDVTLGAFIGSYIRGEKIIEEESIKAMLAELFGDNFKKKLQGFDRHEDWLIDSLRVLNLFFDLHKDDLKAMADKIMKMGQAAR